MEPIERPKADKRLKLFSVVILAWGALIFADLIRLQVVRHADYLDKAQNQHEKGPDIAAPRGSIYDRTGQLLAESLPLESVYIDPLRTPPDVTVDFATNILAGVLTNLDRNELHDRLQHYMAIRKGYMSVAHRITADQASRLRSLNLDWIRFDTASRRNYPRHQLAAEVIGSVDAEEAGNNGIEYSMDTDLRGLPGKQRILSDARGRAIDSQVEIEPHPGVPITLSIDERIQYVAEREIARAVAETHADSGSVVAMLPDTGEIIAMASAPFYDPNVPPTKDEPKNARVNHAITVPFEPGSVFKVITLSAALETTNLTPDSPINCGGGHITLFGRTIHESHGGYGVLPMAMVLAKSSNIGAIQIGMRVGQQNLNDYVHRFGFGSRTGIPLPAESPGMVRKLSRWGATSLSSIAMGHEVGVTTMQLARACSAVANGGLLVSPRLILKKGDTQIPAEAPHRIIRPETAITMRKMMEGVVLFGTGKGHANLQGYSSAGKTGSAQIYDFAARHYTHIYNASFMGFAPVSNPAIVVVVSVNGTHGGNAGFGGPVAGPVFRAVAQEALRVFDVPKDLPDDAPAVAPGNQVADAKAEANDVAISDLAVTDPNILEDTGDGPVQYASLAVPEAPAPKHAPADGSVVPNFRGLSKRGVAALAQERGYQVRLVGKGIAHIQEPPPGRILARGERIRVEFVR